MKIYLAADHAGFDLKETLKAFLTDRGYHVEDCGAYEFVAEDDYPGWIAKAAEQISESPEDRAIVLGGSGQGEAIVANRFPHVRAAVFYGGDGEVAVLSREHNDANVLSLGARFVSPEEAKRIVNVWLNEPFSEDVRHKRRLEKIEELSASN